MHRIRIARAAAALVLASTMAGPARAQERRPVTPLDLYHLRTASQTALSPDGSRVAYVVLQADSATKKYRRELWIARTDGSGAHRLTWLNVSASAPAFSPDGRQLAFVSAREGKPAQIWILPLAEGGEAWPLTSLETAASSLTVSASSDNTTLVKTAGVVFGGSGANRTVTVTPVAGQTGTANITVTVTDGSSATASRTFALTVRPKPVSPTNLHIASVN